MGISILVSGGANSGKSDFAEKKSATLGERKLYIATAKVWDDDFRMKVERHIQRRKNSGWDTFEGYRELDILIEYEKQKYDTVLLDCVTMLITNYMFEYADIENSINDDLKEQILSDILGDMEKLIKKIKDSDINFVFVTNETGLGVIPDNRISRYFMEIAGRVNSYIAENVDQVFFVISGIEIRVK